MTVTLQRFMQGPLEKGRALRTKVKASGEFSKSIKVKRGKWRVRASYDGSGSPLGLRRDSSAS